MRHAQLKSIICYLLISMPYLLCGSTENTVIGNVVTEDPSSYAYIGCIGITPDSATAYAPNASGLNTVTIIDVATNTVTGIVIDEDSLCNNPQAVGVTLDGVSAYVVNTGNNSVAIFDVATNTVTGIVTDTDTTFNSPVTIAMTPDGMLAYVANSGNSTITIIDVATNTVTGIVTDEDSSLSNPYPIAITSDGTTAYIGNLNSYTVSILDIATNTITGIVTDTDSIITFPTGIAVTPDTTKAYVCSHNFSVIAIVDINPANTATYNTIIGIVTDTDMLLGTTQSVGITSDGITAYAANYYGLPFSLGNIAIIDVASDTVTGTVNDPDNLINNPYFLIITPDDSTAYSVSQNGTIQTIITGSPTPPPPHDSILPPSAVTGEQLENVFLTSTHIVNKITWQAPTSGLSPVLYRVYQDEDLTELIKEVFAIGLLEYLEDNCQSGVIYNYWIVSVSIDDQVSTSVHIAIPQNS